jgi:peptidoglycan/LPS O-acetylase OafA/YrhL
MSLLKLNENIAEKEYHLPFIDGIRGVAVLLVLMVHTSQHLGNDHPGAFYFKFSELAVNFGARGVQLFFIISAFTLFNSSRYRFKSEKNPKIAFYIRRFFRIFPLWSIVVIIVSILQNSQLTVIMLNLSFLFGCFRFKEGVELIGPSWSLFVEETFYLILPFLFVYLNYFRTMMFLFFSLILSVTWVIVAPKLGVPTENGFIFLFPLTWYYVFFLGILLNFIVNSKPNFLTSHKLAYKIDIISFSVLFIAIILSGLHFFASIFATFSLALFFCHVLIRLHYLVKFVGVNFL